MTPEVLKVLVDPLQTAMSDVKNSGPTGATSLENGVDT